MKKLYLILITLFSCLGGPKAAAQDGALVFTPQWMAQAQFAGYYVAEAVHAFVGDADQSDDLTMMAIQRI